MLPEAGERSGDELKQWLEHRFLELFRYLDKPPDWIQDGTWPVNENGPLVFLGQLPVHRYFGDEGAVYVFHDQIAGGASDCVTMIQMY